MNRELTNIVIPILPCRSIDEQLAFYKALGFAVMERQTRPNPYASVRYAFIEIHFYGRRNHDPAAAGMCYIRVADIDSLYQHMTENLRRAYGKIPIKGLPRIGKLNDLKEDRRFTVTDPGGNTLYIGRKHDASESEEVNAPESNTKSLSGLARAYETAYALAYSKEDASAAAKVLDAAFAKHTEAPSILRFKALVLRADVATALDDHNTATKVLHEAKQVPLTDSEQEAVEETRKRMLEIEIAMP
ncbi:hypothetical protein ACF3MZ_10845 [Paenibacillaceae bacterium WGS1546]|uniref:hypothetical protein n=1 Tax=Cohnella sp. WGS1546 TaxID=3366810 RepID=UPI00372D2F71